MPNDVTPGTKEALDELAAYLEEVREVWYGLVRRHQDWTPASGSRAERHFGTELVAGDVNQELVRRPFYLAVLLTASGCEHLGGLATLLRGGEVVLSVGALARVVYETAVRAFLCLDPREEVGRLAARAMLSDLISAQQAVYAGEGFAVEREDEWKARAQSRLELGRKRVESCFETVDLSSKYAQRDWTVDGETYLSFDRAAESWETLRAQVAPSGPPQARGYYRVLSLFIHPQAFASHPAMDGSGPMRVTIAAISRLCLAASASMLDAVGLIMNYTGWGDAAEAEVWSHIVQRSEEIYRRYEKAHELSGARPDRIIGSGVLGRPPRRERLLSSPGGAPVDKGACTPRGVLPAGYGMPGLLQVIGRSPRPASLWEASVREGCVAAVKHQGIPVRIV